MRSFTMRQRLTLLLTCSIRGFVANFETVVKPVYVSLVAQFLAFCRAYNLAEARRLSAPWQGAAPAQTRAASRPSGAQGHYLRPSTNCEKLSDRGNLNYC